METYFKGMERLLLLILTRALVRLSSVEMKKIICKSEVISKKHTLNDKARITQEIPSL